jgi:hypothetical protein
VAVLVTDPDERAVPRAAVIGSAAMVLDSPQLNRAGQKGFDFFLDVLNRLRDRPAEIGAPPRAVPTYSVGEVDLFAVLLKPALLLLAGMLALGGLVYVVRQN